MPVWAVYFMGFVKLFSKFGRYADLLLGLVVVTLGVLWHSPVTMALGVFSLAAFAFDLNGWVQRRSLAFAHARVSRRKR